MARSSFDLADLLTSAGAAMAVSNVRLTAANAPALLREFELVLRFDANVQVPCGDLPLQLVGVARRNPQMLALNGNIPANVTVEARYIAAPSLVPVPPAGVVVDP